MKKYCPPHLIMYSSAATKGRDKAVITASFFKRSLMKKPKVYGTRKIDYIYNLEAISNIEAFAENGSEN